MWFLQWILGAVRALADRPEPDRAAERVRLAHAVRLRILWLRLSGLGLEGEQKRERACAVQQLQRVLVDLLAWGFLFHVVGRLPTAGHVPHEGREEAEVHVLTVVARISARGERGLHDGSQPAARFSVDGELEFQTGHAFRPHPLPLLREQGQIAAVHLLGLAMPAAGYVDRDLAAALDVSNTIARALRRGDRVLGLGDLFVLQRRLPPLFALLRGALDTAEAT